MTTIDSKTSTPDLLAFLKAAHYQGELESLNPFVKAAVGYAVTRLSELTKPKVRLRCQNCNAPREGVECFKCHYPLVETAHDWEDPALPPIDRIRELAKEVGYAVAVHGTQQRDLDLVAIPWTEEANTNPREVMGHIARGLDARLVEVEIKPLGRQACTIQMNGWYKPIDLSVAPVVFQPKPHPPLEWSEERKPASGDPSFYNHVIAESPRGRFLIEWKAWKEYDDCMISLGGHFLSTQPTLEDAKLFAYDYLRIIF
jgi:hypothetical protein